MAPPGLREEPDASGTVGGVISCSSRAHQDTFGTNRRCASRRARGACTPRDLMGVNLCDQTSGRPPRPHTVNAGYSHLAHDVCPRQDAVSRRIVKDVFGDDGDKIDSQQQSTGRPRQVGLRHVELPPARARPQSEGSQRYKHRIYNPTGWENPDSYEEPLVPGVRPKGLGGDQRRAFPDLAYPETGCPPKKLPKAPIGATWGGWARNGAPGRRTIDRPWEVDPENDSNEAILRCCDARLKRVPGGESDTKYLTMWHLDRIRDVDKVGRKQINMCQPLRSSSASPRPVNSNVAWMPSAGKSGGGCA